MGKFISEALPITLYSSGLDLLREIRFGVGLGVVLTGLIPTRANTTSQIKDGHFQ